MTPALMAEMGTVAQLVPQSTVDRYHLAWYLPTLRAYHEDHGSTPKYPSWVTRIKDIPNALMSLSSNTQPDDGKRESIRHNAIEQVDLILSLDRPAEIVHLMFTGHRSACLTFSAGETAWVSAGSHAAFLHVVPMPDSNTAERGATITNNTSGNSSRQQNQCHSLAWVSRPFLFLYKGGE
jgi:hypothetical protein